MCIGIKRSESFVIKQPIGFVWSVSGLSAAVRSARLHLGARLHLTDAHATRYECLGGPEKRQVCRSPSRLKTVPLLRTDVHTSHAQRESH